MDKHASISLSDIYENNLTAVINLKVNSEQMNYVAPNVKSLAECYVYRNDGVRPFAILMDELVIGFALLDIDAEDEDVTIWRIMIDEHFQNKGYGRKAIQCLLAWIKVNTEYRSVYIDYVLGNDAAKHLYEALGFENDRINDYGEQVMVLVI